MQFLNMCLYILHYHFLSCDGLVVKALECGQEGCGFKFYLGHKFIIKKDPEFGVSKACIISINVIY
jgi:hypothetical protein